MKNRRSKYLEFLCLPQDETIPMRELARLASRALGWGDNGHRGMVGAAVKLGLTQKRSAASVGASLGAKKPWLRPPSEIPQPKPHHLSDAERDQFYASWEWKRLRYDFLKHKKRKCMCCGRSPDDGVAIHVDHIKPIRHHWHLRLDRNNLQILCEDCNMGKGSHDETDWSRPDPDDPGAVLWG